MNARSDLSPWHCILGFLAVGVFCCAPALEGAAHTKLPADGTSVVRNSRGRMKAGYQIRCDQVPRTPAVHAYRSAMVPACERDRKPLLPASTDDERYGGVAAPQTGGYSDCVLDGECDDCNPCTVDECAAGQCQSTPKHACKRCEDDIFCNGVERCGDEDYVIPGYPDGTLGVCLDAIYIDNPPPDPCFYDPRDYLCDELANYGRGGCVEGCLTEAECSDGLWCTGVESCQERRCIDGPNDGVFGCSSDAECCTDGDCDDDPWPKPICRGLCREGAPPCGEGVSCDEPPFEKCSPGRCCEGEGYATCGRKLFFDPDGGEICQGTWLGIGLPTDECDVPAGPPRTNAGEDFDCPRYESGITSGIVIDLTDEAGTADCRPYREVGDDYNLDVATDYFELTTFRWIGGHVDGARSRMRITFYDSQGTFIEDTITEASYAGGVARRTVIFSDKPVIPAEGIVTVKPAEEFTPGSLIRWGVTDTLTVGGNDDTNIYVDRGDGSGLVAVSAVDEGLAGGTLAFEIVGEEHLAPVGACCSPVTGICELKLPWVCEEESGFFQGIGTSCNVCGNFPDVACGVDPECLLCADGNRKGEPCESNPNACPGGSCIEGVCDENSQNTGEACDCPDSTCDAGTCEAIPPACQMTACCDPNTGDCEEVIGGFCSITTIEPCVSDEDCPNGETCAAPCPLGYVGQGFGTSCDPNCCEQPFYTGGDTCNQAYFHSINVPLLGEDPLTVTITGNNKPATFGDYLPGGGGTCQLDIFDPEGDVRDRGWWEGFCVMGGCFNMRIDMCCTQEMTGETHKPQWDFLLTDCDPCETIIPSRPVDPPIGTGVDAFGYGAPFCNGDDLWQTYAHLPGGHTHLFYPIYTGPGGHVGQYQLHVTVAACDIAACCLPTATCVPGTENEGQPCEQDSDCDPAPRWGDCKPDCQVLDQFACEELDGYWLGRGNIPPGAEPVRECEDAGYRACGQGSCCIGPGACIDEGPGGTPMTLDYCIILLDGTFVGGAMCDYKLNPCPFCQVKGRSNCQVSDFRSEFQTHTSDLTVPPFGVVAADDFVPAGDTIGSLCVWGTYLDASAPGDIGPTGNEQFSCVGQVEDNFRVRIYEDAGGFPGAQVGTDRWIAGDNVFSTQISDDNAFTNGYGIPIVAHMLVLDPPITLPEANATYWLEIANQTDLPASETEPRENTCYWHWAQVYREYGIGNDYSVMGTGDRPEDQGGGIGYVPLPGSARSTDLAFCLGAPGGEPLPFDPPPTPVGSCCMCDGSCAVDTDLATCDDDLIGTWFLQNDCAAGLCDPQPFETCTGWAGTVAMPGLDCGGHGAGGGAIVVPPEGGLYAFDTSCAPTDGPYGTDGVLPGEFVRDVWFEYFTNCTGRLVVSMCATGNANGAYDSILALYSNRSHYCSCPVSSETQEGEAKGENCNGIPDGGAGICTSDIVYPGQCWLIRIGGSRQLPQNEAGAGVVDIRCVPAACTPSHPPEPERLELPPFYPVNQKMRYLSLKIAEADAGARQAIRVHMVDLPKPYDSWNGTKMFVGPPEEFCENAGKVKPPDCPPAQPAGTFWASTLECDPYFTDWSAEGVVHVYHEGIIPGGVYDVQVAKDDCYLTVEDSYSDPLVVQMSRWGDLSRTCTTCPCGPPDGSVGIPTDVTAVLDKFKNLIPPTLPCHAITKVRADLDWETPNQRIDISDVTFCLDAFRGVQYPPPAFDDPSAPPWEPGGQCAWPVASSE